MWITSEYILYSDVIHICALFPMYAHFQVQLVFSGNGEVVDLNGIIWLQIYSVGVAPEMGVGSGLSSLPVLPQRQTLGQQLLLPCCLTHAA